jgi:hypothetical protein
MGDDEMESRMKVIWGLYDRGERDHEAWSFSHVNCGTRCDV